MASFGFFISLAVYFAVGQIQLLPLQPNVVAHNTARLDQWIFYDFIVPATQGFALGLQHASKHDLDIYITRYSSGLPSPASYLYKNTDSAPNVTILGGAEPQEARYIAGIYGFRGLVVPFSIEYTVTNGCPGSCSNRGSCSSGVCQCNEGYAGVKCEYEVTAIESGQNYGPFTTTTEEWKYFSMAMYTQQSMQLVITLRSGVLDAYAKPQSIPSLTSYYLLAPVKSLGISNINITDPQLGTWYFGFFSLADVTQYSFRFDVIQNCPNECSGPSHGHCIGSSCRCTPDYYTSDCGTLRVPVVLENNYTGLATANSWNYYSVSANTANSVMIKLTNADSSSSCHVFVRAKNWPTLTNFTIHNVSSYTGSVSYTRIPQPGFEDWRIGVYAENHCSYSLVVYVEGDAGCSCVHGQCVNGVCACNPGYAGDKCDRQDLVLLSNSTVTGVISKEQWTYYTFDALDCTQMVFILKEVSTTGYVWLFFAVGQQPSLESFLVKEDNPMHVYHRISILFAVPPKVKFPVNVAVYGSPYIPDGETVQYKLVAYETPF